MYKLQASLLQSITWLVLSVVQTSCIIKTRPVSKASQGPSENVLIKARLADQSSTPAADIDVFLGWEFSPRAKSDALGNVTFSVPRTSLQRTGCSNIRGTGQSEVTGLPTSLMFMGRGSTPLTGTSRPIAGSEGPTIDLGQIALSSATAMSGRLMGMSKGYAYAPAPGVVIRLGASQGLTDESGEFSFPFAPQIHGLLTIVRENGSLQCVTLGRQDDSGVLLNPVIMFDEGVVQGAVFSLPVPPGTLKSPNAPSIFEFEVQASTEAAQFRYHDQRAELGNRSFENIVPEFTYSFVAGGSHELFVQLASASGASQSEVLSVPMDGSLGDAESVVTIGDGSGIIGERRQLLHLLVPNGAIAIKVAEDESDLVEDGSAQWRPVASEVEFVFKFPDSGQRVIVFVQFKFADDRKETYSQTALLTPFPIKDQGLFTVDHGASIIRNQVARLDINLPTNAAKMQVSVAEGTGSTENTVTSIFGSRRDTQEAWTPATSPFFVVFSDSGLHRVSVTFMDIDGLESPTYMRTVRIAPFVAQPIGFVVGDGSGFSSQLKLPITLIPPQGAVSYQIWDATLGIAPPNIWNVIVPSFDFVAALSGPRKIAVQYRTIDKIDSAAFTQVVDVNLFPSPTLQATINGGAATTTNKTVTITFPMVPPDAVSVHMSENLALLTSVPHVSMTPPVTFVLSDSIGVKTLYFSFTASNGTVSPAFSQTIELQ